MRFYVKHSNFLSPRILYVTFVATLLVVAAEITALFVVVVVVTVSPPAAAAIAFSSKNTE